MSRELPTHTRWGSFDLKFRFFWLVEETITATYGSGGKTQGGEGGMIITIIGIFWFVRSEIKGRQGGGHNKLWQEIRDGTEKKWKGWSVKKQLKYIALLKEKRIKIILSRVVSLGLAGAEGREGLWAERTARLQEDRLGLHSRESRDGTESLQRQDGLAGWAKTRHWWGKSKTRTSWRSRKDRIYLQACISNKQKNNLWPR